MRFLWFPTHHRTLGLKTPFSPRNYTISKYHEKPEFVTAIYKVVPIVHEPVARSPKAIMVK
ncbi:hypothetical protein ACU8KH_00722 [Lachancea thermotolerans]